MYDKSRSNDIVRQQPCWYITASLVSSMASERIFGPSPTKIMSMGPYSCEIFWLSIYSFFTDLVNRGCIHNQQSERSDLSDEINPVRWKRMPSSDFITVMNTITSLYPIIPQSLWLAIWNWLLKRLRNMHHGRGRGLQKSCGFSPWSQIFLRCVRADLDLIVNEFKQIGLIGFFDYKHNPNCTKNQKTQHPPPFHSFSLGLKLSLYSFLYGAQNNQGMHTRSREYIFKENECVKSSLTCGCWRMQTCTDNACHIWRHIKQRIDMINQERYYLVALVRSQQLATYDAATKSLLNDISIAALTQHKPDS